MFRSSLEVPVAGSVLLLCNGEAPSRTLVRRLARRADIIVAADGGANTARACGIVPNVIIGDLDSVSGPTRRHFRESTVLFVGRQDNTDLEKALDYVAARGAREVVIAGATGKRIDFTLANLAVVWNYTSFLDVRYAADGWGAIPVVSRAVVRARVGTTVSLIPFGACEGVTLKGLEYPLRNAALRIGEVGVSNVVRSSPFTVRVRRGKMLLVVLGEFSRIERAPR
jgi:thiamine pyrophosphokinase